MGVSMNTKRSYLDALNAGRQRRPGASLDHITQSLQNLENKLDRSQDDYRPRRQEDAYGFAGRPSDPIPAGTRHAVAERGYRHEPAERPYRSAPQDYERTRVQEEGVAQANRIAHELKTLRDDLHHQMTSGLHREFETLKRDIERVYAANNNSSVAGVELTSEIERISDQIRTMSERSDDKSVGLLRGEIDQVKRAIEKLAREDTVRSVDRRWDEFDRRWTDFESKVDQRQRQSEPEITALAQRLQTIADAVNNLPESLSLRSLEDKVRTLATAVDHFVRQQERQAPETFSLIEERLDEISRAIVASSAAVQAPNFDPEPFQRIEARIAALASQIEEVATEKPNTEVLSLIGNLSRRVDEIAAQSSVPDVAVERLAEQIAAIADKIDATPGAADSDVLFQGIEHRFDLLSTMIERRQDQAIEQGNAVMRDLEQRLDDLAQRIDRRSDDPVDKRHVMAAIDARFAELAERIGPRESREAAGAAIRGLETRLEGISRRLDESAQQVAGIDPELIRSLENQVAALTLQLNKPRGALPEFDDIGPRLEELERSIASNRDSIIAAAREAAQNAVRAFDGSQHHAAAVAGLADDMRALETLTRRSDQRNTKTFEAIHDTLIKIVDRIGTLDALGNRIAVPPAPAPAPAPEPAMRSAKMEIADAPSIEPTSQSAARIVAEIRNASRPRSPAEAAAEAAVAAAGSEFAHSAGEDGRSKSLLGGIARAFRGRKSETAAAIEPTPVVEREPSLGLDEALDPKLANRPLEPGSGAPDLGAIMRRVRDERGESQSEAAKSDFIAAARRAAQAAAAEAEALKRDGDVADQIRGSHDAATTKSRRKPLLMAATALVVVLAGMQLGKAFLGNEEDGIAETLPEIGAAQPEPDAVTSAAPAVTADEELPEAGTSVRMAGEDTADPQADTSAATAASPAPSTEMSPAGSGTVAAAMTGDAAPAGTTSAPATVPPAAVDISSIPVEAGPVPLREAAASGDAKALFEIGSRYADGRGVTSNMGEAAKWYQKSADLGFAPAQYRIGNFYEKGIGVERDVAKAKTWYQLSAEQGNASAMHNLAVLFAMGADGTTDNDSAARWFTRAANFGIKDSQFNLGILAAKGVGMKQDLEESYKWFAIVAKAGDRDAATKRDEIANSLRPEQLEAARAAVDLWKPQQLDAKANDVDIPEAWQESAGTTASIDMKKAIGNIQRILNKNGYDAGSPDGVMGEKTKNAIKAFQQDNGMPATGEVDEPLVRALIAKK